MPTAEWIPVPDVPDQIDEMLFDDLDLIQELTHTVRGRVLHLLRQPHSVAELAEALDVPVTRLYHHIKRLEQLGVISIVATRQIGARTERRYRNVAFGYRLDDKVLTATDPGTFARAIGSLFDIARTEFQREVDIGALTPERVSGRATIGFNEFALDEQQLGEFLDRLHALLEEYGRVDETTDTGHRWRLFLAGFPLTE